MKQWVPVALDIEITVMLDLMPCSIVISQETYHSFVMLLLPYSQKWRQNIDQEHTGTLLTTNLRRRTSKCRVLFKVMHSVQRLNVILCTPCLLQHNYILINKYTRTISGYTPRNSHAQWDTSANCCSAASRGLSTRRVGGADNCIST